MARAVRRTLRAMWWERIARSFWPAFAIIGFGVAALALGVGAVLPLAVLRWTGAGWVVLAAAALLVGVVRFRWPRRAAARARVDATLPGRPLTALRDRVALGGGEAGAAGLWQAHLARMHRAARQARGVPGNADLGRGDPLGLRLVALIALVMALLFGSISQLRHDLVAVAATFQPVWSGETGTGAGWEGWAQPPAYTRRPSIYLNALPERAGLTLPQGSRLSIRLYASGARLAQDIGGEAASADGGTDAHGAALEITAERSGTLSVADRRFAVTVVPDQPPEVHAGQAPERRADGRLVQAFSASDDNGVAHGAAEIALDLAAVDRRHGLAVAPELRPPLRLALPLPARNGGTAIDGRLSADFSRNPLANLPVTIRLHVEDGIGQQAEAAPLHTVLPGRRFFDPMAAALIELRRDLLWSRANAGRAAQVLRAVIWQPGGDDAGDTDGALQGVIARLEAAPLTVEQRDDVAGILWEVAIEIEDGGLSDALDAMQSARQRLSEAIRNGATKDEIARLMDELKRASDAYIRMLAERDGSDPADRFVKQQPAQQISGDHIQQMMDEIERLMAEGRMAEAQAALDQFARMMDNLKVTQGEGEGGAGNPQGRLTDTLRRQQQLADDAMREMQRGAGQPWGEAPADDADGAGRQGNQDDDGGDLAARQRDLREGLDAQRGLLPGPGTAEGDSARQALDRAGEAMRGAEGALERGDNGLAMARQADAIEAMRDGLRALGRMQDGGQTGEATGGERGAGSLQQGAGDQARPRSDPLGRDVGGVGDGGTGALPGTDDLAAGDGTGARARALLDEIRRRSGERQRPEAERDYLDRLLDRF